MINDFANQGVFANDLDYEERSKLMQKKKQQDTYNRVIRFDGKKNPNNPRELLNKANEVFISKKAHYIDCISCHCSIGENIYKVYRYKHPKH